MNERMRDMNEEISKILKMVQDGKITADKAQELIESLKDKNTELVKSSEEKRSDDIMDKMLKIKVNSHEGDNVNVKLPVKFIKIMLKTVGKIPISDSVRGMENIDLNLISEAIDSGLSGKIVDVKSADGDIVEVSIE
jgi:polyhydroxyalkanoate synthesis regulator phasin